MKYTINVKHGSYGPSHDQYSTLKITVCSGALVAEYFQGGLGDCSVSLYTGNVKRTLSFRDDDRINALKAVLLFKRHVGMKPMEAQEEYELGCTPDMYMPSYY